MQHHATIMSCHESCKTSRETVNLLPAIRAGRGECVAHQKKLAPGPARVADGQAVGRALRGAPPHAGAPGATSGAGATPVCTEYSCARLLEGDALVLSALEIIAHFGPLVIENPATGLLKTLTYCKYGTPYRKQTRLWTNVCWRPRRGLCRPGSRCEAWQDGRHLRAAQRGPRLMEGQCERVSQSRELLYSVPAALCEEIARAATEELAERLSIPD